MTSCSRLAILAASLWVAHAALAQPVTEGPLDAPGVAGQVHAPVAKTSTHRHAGKHSAKVRTGAPAAAASEPGGPAESAGSAVPPVDPLDFGMKWNGSNDSAEKTRVQNYNGAASGTGAEVGMKLHF